MIKLEFLQIEPWSYKELLNVSDWTSIEGWPAQYLEFRGFFGGQIFMIDDCDYSGDYPILGFAKTLRDLSLHLVQPGQQGSLTDPACEKPSYTLFSSNSENVIIEEIEYRSERRMCSAAITVKELDVCSNNYLNSVLAHCSALVPGLTENASFRTWIDNYSLPRIDSRSDFA
jgi:hypothetical protein